MTKEELTEAEEKYWEWQDILNKAEDQSVDRCPHDCRDPRHYKVYET